ncbi:hypothetical protein ACUX4R_26745, partial [Salmonella enterica]
HQKATKMSNTGEKASLEGGSICSSLQPVLLPPCVHHQISYLPLQQINQNASKLLKLAGKIIP